EHAQASLIFSNILLPFTPLNPSIRLRFQTLLLKSSALRFFARLLSSISPTIKSSDAVGRRIR
ncbi:MAG: hypothetical protein KKB36_05665, partial [Gammaproteobacteria bacterium]|nr:hypothetical protein [Gammaproteobacteria bacterium]